MNNVLQTSKSFKTSEHYVKAQENLAKIEKAIDFEEKNRTVFNLSDYIQSYNTLIESVIKTNDAGSIQPNLQIAHLKLKNSLTKLEKRIVSVCVKAGITPPSKGLFKQLQINEQPTVQSSRKQWAERSAIVGTLIASAVIASAPDQIYTLFKNAQEEVTNTIKYAPETIRSYINVHNANNSIKRLSKTITGYILSLPYELLTFSSINDKGYYESKANNVYITTMSLSAGGVAAATLNYALLGTTPTLTSLFFGTVCTAPTLNWISDLYTGKSNSMGVYTADTIDKVSKYGLTVSEAMCSGCINNVVQTIETHSTETQLLLGTAFLGASSIAYPEVFVPIGSDLIGKGLELSSPSENFSLIQRGVSLISLPIGWVTRRILIGRSAQDPNSTVGQWLKKNYILNLTYAGTSLLLNSAGVIVDNGYQLVYKPLTNYLVKPSELTNVKEINNQDKKPNETKI